MDVVTILILLSVGECPPRSCDVLLLSLEPWPSASRWRSLYLEIVNLSGRHSECEWVTLLVCILETGIIFCGADARSGYGTAYFFEGEVEVHVIPTQPGKQIPSHETIPHFLQTNCGGVIPLCTEEIDKLAVD